MRKQLTAAMLVGLLGLSGTALAAQSVRFGPQLGVGTNNLNLGIGGRMDLNLAKSLGAPIDGVGSVDYFTGTAGVHLWEINVDGFYDFTIPKSNLTPYAGGGLNIAFASCTGCGSEAGLNLGGGVKFKLPHSTITPFLEARIEVRTDGAFVIGGGLLF